MSSGAFWWVPPAEAAAPAPAARIAPRETLYHYDEPINFVADGDAGALICLKVDDDGTRAQFLAAPVNGDAVDRLKAGLLSLRSAIVATRVWILATDRDYAVLGAWSLDPAEIPDELLPDPGCGIWAEHGTISEDGPTV